MSNLPMTGKDVVERWAAEHPMHGGDFHAPCRKALADAIDQAQAPLREAMKGIECPLCGAHFNMLLSSRSLNSVDSKEE